ncbi:MAG: type IV toxin-antitoxin system AbiEi family antitoxin domain-containing protein [Micrococcales bacterium]|nr:type IV toxin-antitoxin system AbiEi family antitoxin domain-containing protein [Micrococcales bacterium]
MSGFFTTAQLNEHGIGHRGIAAAVRAGTLLRLRRGRYCTPDAPHELAAAVRVGGALSCVSALRHHGVWVLERDELHVRVARGVAAGAGATVHWCDQQRLTHAPLDDPETALGVAIGCLPFRSAVVVADSLANRRILPVQTVEAVCMRTPRGRRVLGVLEPRSESGLETLARLALRSRRVRIRPQVEIPGIGRVDLLIGDRLVLELDGETFHQDFDRDRARDRALILAGYLPVRVSYRQLMRDWGEVERQLLELVRRGEHLRRPLAMV